MHLRLHARLGLPGRGRPDAPADRAARDAARDAERQRPIVRPTRSKRSSAGSSPCSPTPASRSLVLTRQKVAVPRRSRRRGVARGAYVLRDTEGDARPDPDRDRLGSLARARRRAACSATSGLAARVVSMPCWELFDRARPGVSRQRAAAGGRSARCRSKPARRSAGTAGSATAASRSGSTTSARRRRPRRSPRTSASRPSTSPTSPPACWPAFALTPR